MAIVRALNQLTPNMPLVFGGDRIIEVPETIAERFSSGDSLVIVESTEELLHVPAAAKQTASQAVDRAVHAFSALSRAADDAVDAFYRAFARRLRDDAVWARIASANAQDVADAQARGRSTTRLVASEKMRADMAAGLEGWIGAPSMRDRVLETVEHEGWRAELVGAPLGVVAFVFEGRPNVLADATGVLRGGNTVVFRIGSDALRTARSIIKDALEPSLRDAGLPEGAVTLVDDASHAACWALFSDRRLALAVARGSGPAVATLGALAQQAGVPVSLHGTGGAWLFADDGARAGAFEDAVFRSLDRKVCNTLNTCCIPRRRAADLVPALLRGLERAGKRLETTFKIHVVEGDEDVLPEPLRARQTTVIRASGTTLEAQVETIPEGELGHEWEWEQTPEVTLKVVDDLTQAIGLFNRYSPQFVACLITDDDDAFQAFYRAVNAPFVGDGFTRWVDGQFALGRPELGLSNWQWGRLFGRGGVLSGETVYTIRTRALGTSP
jgi:glutamate-5-semialdehyde dehydrogenase